MGLEHRREVLGLVAQDASLCSSVSFAGRWGEAASDPPVPLQSLDGQAGGDEAHPSVAQAGGDEAHPSLASSRW